jgi:hypothetical protein
MAAWPAGENESTNRHAPDGTRDFAPIWTNRLVSPERVLVGPSTGSTSSFVQMSTIPNLPPSIATPLNALQRAMLLSAWEGELWRDARGVSISGCRASIVTLRVLQQRGLVEKGGGQVGITQDGLVALELLYTDPREWSTPIEAVTGPTQRTI